LPVDNALYDNSGDIWWDEHEPLSMLLTMMNPARVAYFKDVVDEAGRKGSPETIVLDVGCGGGLLAEEFARAGFTVNGIDPSWASVRTAREHAVTSGLPIRYIAADGDRLPLANESCHVVLCCDVLEHVEDPVRLIAEISRVLKAGGVFLYDTINRTLRSRIAVIGIFQQCAWTSCAPRNLHDWNKFIRPAELRRMILQCGLSPGGIAGLKPRSNPIDLIRQMRRRKRREISYGELGRRMAMRKNDDVSMSYMGWAVKAHNMPVGDLHFFASTGDQ
jgi:2-polyprenyl-6-hydroxyphenyl methylase / 3-demethylubiquinone-9 3-methyltransferase